MRQIVQIVRKVDMEKQYKEVLEKEQDYELLCLADAMKTNDIQEVARSKQRLVEIHDELATLIT